MLYTVTVTSRIICRKTNYSKGIRRNPGIISCVQQPEIEKESALTFQTSRRRCMAFTVAAVEMISHSPAEAMPSLKEVLVQQALQSYGADLGPAGSNGNGVNVDESSMNPVRTLSSGVRIRDVQMGSGKVPTTGDLVVLQVVMTTRNGADIIDTRRENEPLTLTLGILPREVCEGLEEGIRGMKEGGRRLMDVPAEMAYGQTLGPLRFDVEMLRFVRLESGSIVCCPDKLYPCDKVSEDTKGIVTLNYGTNEERPLSKEFVNLGFYIDQPTMSDMTLID